MLYAISALLIAAGIGCVYACIRIEGIEAPQSTAVSRVLGRVGAVCVVSGLGALFIAIARSVAWSLAVGL